MKFRYLIISRGLNSREDFEAHLNALGIEGWELVAVVVSNHSNHHAYLKQPI